MGPKGGPNVRKMTQRFILQAMDKMRERFGDRAVIRANGINARSISRWNPFNREPPPLLANRRQ